MGELRVGDLVHVRMELSVRAQREILARERKVQTHYWPLGEVLEIHGDGTAEVVTFDSCFRSPLTGRWTRTFRKPLTDLEVRP